MGLFSLVRVAVYTAVAAAGLTLAAVALFAVANVAIGWAGTRAVPRTGSQDTATAAASPAPLLLDAPLVRPIERRPDGGGLSQELAASTAPASTAPPTPAPAAPAAPTITPTAPAPEPTPTPAPSPTRQAEARPAPWVLLPRPEPDSRVAPGPLTVEARGRGAAPIAEIRLLLNGAALPVALEQRSETIWRGQAPASVGPGRHTVRAVVVDAQGQVGSYTWSFVATPP